MKIVAIVNHKGGVGKTTTAVCLSGALVEQGKRILLLDLDPQASASKWLERDDTGRASLKRSWMMGTSYRLSVRPKRH